MRLTTQQLIQVLPMEDRLRLELRATFETAKPHEQFRISTLLWEQYNNYVDLRTQENVQLVLTDKDAQAQVKGNDFYQHIRERTEREILTEASNSSAAKRLSSVRDAVQQLISSIKNEESTR